VGLRIEPYTTRSKDVLINSVHHRPPSMWLLMASAPEPENNRTVVYEDFFCRWLVHASASGPG
jgi:hypothetical protein